MKPTMTKHTILFLAANSHQTAQLAPDREARAIQDALQCCGRRDCFEFITRWAADSLDLLREQRKQNPTVMHLSGPCDPQHGLLLPTPDGQLRHVSGEALKETFDAVGASVQLVVLSGCYSEALARTLAEYVDCVVGMRSTITDDAALQFMAGFYGALGDGCSVWAAFRQGCTAIHLSGLPDNDKPQLIARPGADPAKIVLASASDQTSLNGPDRGHLEKPDVPEDADLLANVLFVLIEGLKDCLDGPRIPRALGALNAALREIDSSAFVLSTLTGAIVVIPDGASGSVDATLEALGRSSVGFALRVGVAHGVVDAVTVIDGQRNFAGLPINIAAQLASSSDNPGSLFHESYAEFVGPTLAETHWLHRSRRTPRTVTGKPQDSPFTCFAAPYHLDAVDAHPPASRELPAWRSAALIACDLPGSSAGDRAQLRKRFTLLGRVFRRLSHRNPSAQASALLSPSGDGGVFVLAGVRPAQAADIASELYKFIEIESRDHADPITGSFRVGAHYGQVTSYHDARGLTRPAGLEVFVADEIASDEHARRLPGVILTKMVADSVAGGSAEQSHLKFEPLPVRTQGPAANIKRYRTTPAPERWPDEDDHLEAISGSEDELGRRFRFTRFGIPIGLGLGGLLGAFAPGALTELLRQFATLFPIVMQALLVPLLVGAVIRGVAAGTGNLDSARRILKFARKVLVWFIFSMAAAGIIGVVIAEKVAPEEKMICLPHESEQPKYDTAETIAHSFPWVFFGSALLGLVMPLVGSKGKPIMQVIDSAEAVAFKMASFVPLIVPFAAGFSVAAHIGIHRFDYLGLMARCIVFGYGSLSAYVVLLLIVMRALTRIRLRTFWSAIFRPAAVAFATRTSGAAMPLTMQVLVQLGIPRNIVSFVVPTGSLFNLAGSALYIIFAVVYTTSQCHGANISFGEQLQITANLMLPWALIAGVPGGSLSVIKLYAPGNFWESLVAIDLFMDMGRTCVNVISNSVAAVVVAAWENRIHSPSTQLRSPRK